MTRSQIEIRMRMLLVEQLDVDEKDLSPEARFADDVGADSLARVQMVLACEEEFGINISDEDAARIRTVGDWFDLVQRLTTCAPVGVAR